jgi:regulation of enolase protein 1 (concanavalin A-like superfamily)
LKIARHGNSYVFYSSDDGKDWNFLRHFPLEVNAPVKVGFLAQSPVGDALTVKFSDVNYRGETFKDYWQGE